MYRIGHGYDVHPLVPTRPLILGGVTIPYYKGLLGHSDADALIHAICDALLGAAALGDIGLLFPDEGPEWEGVAGKVLLENVGGILKKRGYRIENIDSTILADKPKMRDHIPAMIKNIAAALQIEPALINVKATTSEGMGFIGEGEGIAAYAVCIISQEGSPTK